MSLWGYSDVMAEYKVRMPDELYERVTQAAAADRRSINSELLVLIESALDQDSAERTSQWGLSSHAAAEIGGEAW